VSLRARLLTVLVSLTAVGLTVAGIATYASLRSFLVQRVDRTVTGNAAALARSLEVRGRLDPGDVDALGVSNPGVYIGLAVSGQPLRWAPVGVRPGETPPPQPNLPADRATGPAVGTHPFTVHAVTGDTQFRVQLEPLNSGQTLVVAAPLTDVADTLHQLLLVEVIVALSVLGAIFVLGLYLVRVGLRPLRRIEQTAAAIAGGDLSERVENDDPRTEVGRLGGALNAMLGQIEQAFDERTASENRLRRFVADASHELRTPLAAVRAYAELFDRGARERPDDLERAMTGIQRESRRMGLLVDDLLLLARLDQGRPLERKPVVLDQVAREAVEAAKTLDPGREIDLEAPGHVEVEGDRERLRQVLDNLLANVRSHTPPGSAAAVRVSNGGDQAVVEVADTGPGLSKEQLEHVFERFYRGDTSRSRDQGGAGLGLAIAAAIAKSHGGTATVVNAGRDGGPGLTVRVVLPLGGASTGTESVPVGATAEATPA